MLKAQSAAQPAFLLPSQPFKSCGFGANVRLLTGFATRIPKGGKPTSQRLSLLRSLLFCFLHSPSNPADLGLMYAP
jgi:hypothetical protein